MKVSTALLAASGWIALAATALPAGSPARIAATLAFVLICPGAALLRLVAAAAPAQAGRYEPLLAVTLAVAASLAVATLASEAFFLTGSFTMPRCVTALSVLTSALAFTPSLIQANEH